MASRLSLPWPRRCLSHACRWYSLFQHSNPLWLFLRISVAYRKQAAIWDAGVAETVYVDNNTLVLARGDFVIVLTNVGQAGPARRGFLTLHELPPRFDGSTLRNIYNRTVSWVPGSCGLDGTTGIAHCRHHNRAAHADAPSTLCCRTSWRSAPTALACCCQTQLASRRCFSRAPSPTRSLSTWPRG